MNACLTTELKRALLAQVCCGIPELCEYLECELQLLWDCQNECIFRQRYIFTQLGLIEAAQVFARNKIDTMTREASSQMQERYSAFAMHKSDSERDASGRSCSWAAATSSQFFNRDSEDQAIGWSDYRHQYTSDLLNNGFDLSCRHTFGYAFHKTKITSQHTGKFDEVGAISSNRKNSVSGGTQDLLPIYTFEYTGFDHGGILSLPWVGAQTPEDITSYFLVPANNKEEVCHTYNTNTDDPDEFPDCNTSRKFFPSAGSGWNERRQFGIGFLLFSITVEWHKGKNQRQYYHCTGAKLDATGSRTHTSVNTDYSLTEGLPSDNNAYSNENSTTLHLVRKYGIITRRSTTDNDAQEQSEGFSNGLANSESERNAKATNYVQQRAEAESSRHSESHYLRTERANNDMVSAKYGQISKHLKALWDRIWEQHQVLERQYAAKPYGASMYCPKESKSCLPVRRSWHDLKRVALHG